ncbi:MAG: putative zinc-binding metallopeptidase [Candidatus Pseudobacter hemicellulosilyticus]|uniref:Zinc-binding metallopeptidase n=1 Tax=Candidatus Pseudobacter hemicellulosilyticus TaxID=3121375 RepID=A0AAJ6BII3_9BACT|nr:MAG: putative zinc-binding metallopeptidase [Pseudobacter sp.]
MRTFTHYIIGSCLALSLFSSCKKDELDTSYELNGLGGDTWAKGEIDKWINDNLTVPYNMEILYKWDQFNAGDVNKTLVPPQEDKVLPLLQTINKIWIEPYVKAGGLTFMKKYIIKQIALVGSPSYNSNGTITLGEAEGGKKIILYTVNDFTNANRGAVEGRMRTIHHEFAHILHQTVLFTPDYERITAADYTGDWTNVSQATARSKGFVSPYAMSSKEEDFVEMVAHMLVYGPDGFEAIVNSSSTTAGRDALRKKQAIVVAYYKSVWNIDFSLLQRYVGEALDAVSPVAVTPLTAALGFGKQYKAIRSVKEMQTSEGFKSAMNEANTTLQNTFTAIYTIDSMALRFNKTDTATLNIKFYSLTAPATLYTASFKYKFTVNASGVYTFENPVASGAEAAFGNARLIGNYVLPLILFFSSHPFKPDWINGKLDRFSTIQVGKWIAQDDNSLYFIGNLSTSDL